MQVPQLCVEGVEADDVIATLATQGAAEGMDVIVVTGDRDAFQLIEDPHIKVLYNRRGVSDYVLYDEAGIAERYLGVTARQYPQYAALRGDNSDNLPGVPGHRREDRRRPDREVRRPRRGLRAPRRAAAQAAPEPGGAPGTGPPQPDDDLAAARRGAGVRPDRAPPGAVGPRGGADAVQPAGVPVALRPAARWPWARRRRRPETDALECVVDNLGEPEAAARFLGEVARPAGQRYVLEGRFAAALGRSDLLGLAVAVDDASATYLPAHVLEAPAVGRRPGRHWSGRAGRRWSPTGPRSWPTACAGCREPGRTAARSTSGPSTSTPPWPPTSSTRPRARYELPDLARRYLQLDVAAGTAAAEGHARPRRAAPASTRRAGGRPPSTAWPSPWRTGWRPGS